MADLKALAEQLRKLTNLLLSLRMSMELNPLLLQLSLQVPLKVVLPLRKRRQTSMLS